MIFAVMQKGEPMSNLISRQKAIDTVHRMREIWDTGDVDDLEEMIVTALAELCPEQPDLEELDFVQPHPKTSVTLETLPQTQRIGRWKRCWVGTIAEGLFCDVCHKRGYGEDICTHCGARMEGENE